MVRTRFAPSPTGFLHIGSIYQVMINYAFARQQKGRFVLRIEDTDQKRLVKGAEEQIYQALSWFGFRPDEGPKEGGPYAPYRQSERLSFYRRIAEKLVNQGAAYYCFCSPQRLEQLRQQQLALKQPPRYDGHCRHLSELEIKKKLKEGKSYVIRLKAPEKEEVVVPDLLRGKVNFKANQIDDQVLLKSDGFPTYHLAAPVDDHLMKITHVIRGEEWLSSAPKYVLLYHYLNWSLPVFVHTPILRNPDGSKVSKREGHAAVDWYRQEGFLPEAILNFLALLGWSHPQQKEVFSFAEFIKHFRLEDLSPVSPTLDLQKLEWLNGVYIRQRKPAELARLLAPFLPRLDKEKIKAAAPLIQERIKRLRQAEELLAFLWQEPQYEASLLLQRGINRQEAKEMLQVACRIIVSRSFGEVRKIQEEFLAEIKRRQWNTGAFFMVFRVALTGQTVTPPIIESLPLLGKEEALRRLEVALAKLERE